MHSAKWWLALVVLLALGGGVQASEWPWSGCLNWQSTFARFREEVDREKRATEIADLKKQSEKCYREGKYREAWLLSMRAKDIDVDNLAILTPIPQADLMQANLNYDMRIRTVYVPIFKNTSYLVNRQIEFQLTEAVVREIESKTPFKVESCRDRADLELLGTLVSRSKAPTVINPLQELCDLESTLTVECSWRDLRPGHEQDKQLPIIAPVTAKITPELNMPFSLEPTFDQMAVDIVSSMNEKVGENAIPNSLSSQPLVVSPWADAQEQILLAALRKLQEEETKVYYIQFRALEAQRHGKPNVLSRPIMASTLGQDMRCMIGQNFPLTPEDRIDTGIMVKACLVKLTNGQLRLYVDYHYSGVEKADNGGTNISGIGLQFAGVVELGKMIQLPVQRGPGGKLRHWLEVTVTDSPPWQEERFSW